MTRYQKFTPISVSSWGKVSSGYDFQFKEDVALLEFHNWANLSKDEMLTLVAKARKLECSTITNVSDVVVDENLLVLNVDLRGGSIRQTIERRPLLPTIGRAVLKRGLEALVQLEKVGFTHGDVSPETMLLPKPVGDNAPRPEEFRLLFSPGPLWNGCLTPNRNHKYSAPEMFIPDFGEISPKTDVYCLAFTVLELLTGTDFDSFFRRVNSNWQTWHAHASETLPPIETLVPDLDDELADLLSRMLEREVAKRPSASEALAALEVVPLPSKVDMRKHGRKATSFVQKPYVVWPLCSAIVAFTALAVANKQTEQTRFYSAPLVFNSPEVQKEARVFWVDPSFEQEFELPRTARGEWLFPRNKLPFVASRKYRVEADGYSNAVEISPTFMKQKDGSYVCRDKDNLVVELAEEETPKLTIKTELPSQPDLYAQNIETPGETYIKERLVTKNNKIRLPKGRYFCAVYQKDRRPLWFDGQVDLLKDSELPDKLEKELKDSFEAESNVVWERKNLDKQSAVVVQSEIVFRLLFFASTSILKISDSVSATEEASRLFWDNGESNRHWNRFGECYDQRDELLVEEDLALLESDISKKIDEGILWLCESRPFACVESDALNPWRRLYTFCQELQENYDKTMRSELSSNVKRWKICASAILDWNNFWLENGGDDLENGGNKIIKSLANDLEKKELESKLKGTNADNAGLSYNIDAFLARYYFVWAVAFEVSLAKDKAMGKTNGNFDDKYKNLAVSCWERAKDFCDSCLRNSYDDVWKYRSVYANMRSLILKGKDDPQAWVDDCAKSFDELLKIKDLELDALLGYVEARLASPKLEEKEFEKVKGLTKDIEASSRDDELRHMYSLYLMAQAHKENVKTFVECYEKYTEDVCNLAAKDAENFFPDEFLPCATEIDARWNELTKELETSLIRPENSPSLEKWEKARVDSTAIYGKSLVAPVCKRETRLLNWNNSLVPTLRQLKTPSMEATGTTEKETEPAETASTETTAVSENVSSEELSND